MSETLLTVKEVAERISVSEWAIRNWVRQGKVPGARRYGRTIRIPESFVTQGTEAGGVEPDVDYDPRDHWPTVEPGPDIETPEPLAPPTEDDEEEED